ncbi:MAG: copper chaperone PCu(A)C [Variovorax sp.]|nr:copper chaperone PCu(A)C [Variovorax sp.]
MNTPMNASFSLRQLAACIVLAGSGSAFAHVTLPPGGATVGSEYEAAFRVGHACQGAKSTTGITVRLPRGFAFTDAQARKGWKLEAPPAGDNGGEVRWTAENADAALPTTPGVLWFKVLQNCDNGSADWAQIPASGTSTAGLESPAARLDVLAAGVAPVDVRDAWIRASVPGQSGSGAFMKLSAPSGARLVGASTPVAGVAEVHEMKMEGDTMRMRGLPSLELPARQTVELKPGGYHLMLMDLKQPLVNGTTVPLTLLFEDAKGQKSSLEIKVPVQTASGTAAAGEHKH